MVSQNVLTFFIEKFSNIFYKYFSMILIFI